jgi:hypothetical protein
MKKHLKVNTSYNKSVLYYLCFFSVIGSAKARQHVYGFVLFYLWENIETIISLLNEHKRLFKYAFSNKL